MPKSKRDLLKRQIAHAYMAMDRAIIHLDTVAKPFEEQHPELTEPLIALILMLDEGKKVIDAWVAKVWQREGMDYEDWANEQQSQPKNPLKPLNTKDIDRLRKVTKILNNTDTEK